MPLGLTGTQGEYKFSVKVRYTDASENGMARNAIIFR